MCEENILIFNNIVERINNLYNKYSYYNAYLKNNNKKPYEIIKLNDINLIKKYYLKNFNDEKKYLSYQQIRYVELLNKFNNNMYEKKILNNNKLNYINNRIDIYTKIVINKIKFFNKTYESYINILLTDNNNINRLLIMKKQKMLYKNNLKNIHKLLKYKKIKAKIYNFDNYADYILQNNMAKNSNTIILFLNSIKVKLKPLLIKELDIIRNEALKDGINEIKESDIMYYTNKINSSSNNINFDLKKIINKIFLIFKKLFNYEFIHFNIESYKEINKKYNKKFNEDLDFFTHDMNHPDIKKNYYVLYNKKVIGILFFDLYKNENKYTTAEIIPLTYKTNKIIPIFIMKCNFNNNNIINYDELIILFHEFGHFIQNISKNNKYNFDNITDMTDANEIPSQIFEEFCYNDNVLSMMTDNKNYKHDKKYQFKYIELGMQLVYSYIDIYLHKNYNCNTDFDKIYSEIYFSIFNLKNEINPIYNFIHMYEEYDAKYYSYLWAAVYSKDIYYSKLSQYISKMDWLSSEVSLKKHEENNIGYEFKNKILNSFDYDDQLLLINNYLEREVNIDFLFM